MTPERWEHGSDPHWPELDLETAPSGGPALEGVLTGSGRDALALLIAHGRAERGWKRLWMPSFGCSDVVDHAAERIDVALYDDRRTARLPRFDEGDVLLRTNTHGLRAQPSHRPDIDVIDDHTHDPWSPWALASNADFAFASLRKTLPLPDGGSLWSPREHALPDAPEATEAHLAATQDRFEAMVLKTAYLRGEDVDKARFREHAVRGEQAIAAGEPSGMSPISRERLAVLPWATWRETRAANVAHLSAALEAGGMEVLASEVGGGCPLGVIVKFASRAERDARRKHLIGRRIYPAILWDLEPLRERGVDAETMALSERLLVVHADWRYAAPDLDRVAAAMTEQAAP